MAIYHGQQYTEKLACIQFDCEKKKADTKIKRLHRRSVAQLCSTLCDHMHCSMQGFPEHHYSQSLLKHVHQVGDAIQPSHPLSAPSPAFPASGSFQMSQFFSSSGQSVRVSASISLLPVNIQDWFPLGLTGWSPCTPKDSQETSPNTTVQKHEFFGAQLSLWSNSHIHTWPLEKP